MLFSFSHSINGKRLLLGVVFFIGCVNYAFAQTTVKPTLADYAALPSLQSVSISPSGEMLAFVHSVENNQIVKLLDLTTRKVVAGFDVGKVKPRSVSFIDNDRVIVRIESENRRIWGYGVYRDMSVSFVYSIKKQSIRQLLTPGDVIYTGQSSIGRIVAISDDKKHAYMPAWSPKRKGLEQVRYSLMKVSLGQKKKSPKVHIYGDFGTIDFFMDGKDNLLAMVRYIEKSGSYQIEVPEGKGRKIIYQSSEPLRKIIVVGVSPTGKHLILKKHNVETDHFSYFSMSLADGAISENLFSHVEKDVAYPLVDQQRVVHGVAYKGFTPTYEFIDKKLLKRVENIQAMFEGESVTIASYSPDWKHVVVHVSGSVYSGDYFLISEGKPPFSIASQYEKFQGEHLHPIFSMSIKARDGRIIPTLVTVPYARQESLNKLPAIVFPHGGPASHDKIRFYWITQALANEGYLIIQPQFRGSTGFGAEHLVAGDGQWGKEMQTDLIDTLGNLVSEGIVDKERVCIAGWSYGGYAALAGGAFHSDVFKCVVSVNGVSDLEAILKKEKNEKSTYWNAYEYWKLLIANGIPKKENLRKVSPARHADNFSAPVLLIYGDEDENVLPEQSKRMAKALKAAGKDYKLLKIEGEEHSFEDRDNRLKTLTAIVEFIGEHINK